LITVWDLRALYPVFFSVSKGREKALIGNKDPGYLRHLEFSKKVRQGAYLQIQYEKLLDEPLVTLAEIEKFLEIELTVERKNRFMSSHESNNLKGNHGKWRDKMIVNDQRIYEAVAGETLRRYGYETLFEKPSVSMPEILRALAAELWRKVRLNLG